LLPPANDTTADPTPRLRLFPGDELRRQVSRVRYERARNEHCGCAGPIVARHVRCAHGPLGPLSRSVAAVCEVNLTGL